MIAAMANLLWSVGWVLPTALCLLCAQGLAHAEDTPAGRQAALEQPSGFGRALLASASMPLAAMDLRKLDNIRTDGVDARKLGKNLASFHQAQDPDGRMLLYRRNHSINTRFCAVSIDRDGGRAVAVISRSAPTYQPQFGNAPDEADEAAGFKFVPSWSDNLPRIRGAVRENDLPDSPWMPVEIDPNQRQRSYNPGAGDERMPAYPVMPWAEPLNKLGKSNIDHKPAPHPAAQRSL